MSHIFTPSLFLLSGLAVSLSFPLSLLPVSHPTRLSLSLSPVTLARWPAAGGCPVPHTPTLSSGPAATHPSSPTPSGKDIWIFDIDDALFFTMPYFKKHQVGGAMMNRTSMEQWMEERSAPAVEHMLDLHHKIRARGLKVFLISSRREHLRDATIDNLVKVGYLVWTELILRCVEDSYDAVANYKAEQWRKLIDQGYCLWGIMGER